MQIMPADSARWLARQLVARGIPPARVLQGTGLSPSWIEREDARILSSQYLTIVHNALDASGDPALGLTVGPRQSLGELGFWGYAILSSPTLGEANRAALRFWELNGSLVTLACTEGPHLVTWEIAPAFPLDSRRVWVFAVEELLSTFYTAARFLSRDAFRFTEIRLSYPDPGHGRLYREQFHCPVLFGQNRDRFQCSRALASRPTSLGHPGMALICRQQCQELQARLRTADPLAGRIREILIASRGRFPPLPEVSRRLALSARSLRRRLQEKGTSYQRILDEVRAALARQYLASTNLGVDEIASRLGFSEGAAFRRAFRKWSGMTVGSFKKGETRPSPDRA